tara:strand:- start:82 stop:978 length:897 start_codon:yes stop_codon:yes gene_type:complete
VYRGHENLKPDKKHFFLKKRFLIPTSILITVSSLFAVLCLYSGYFFLPAFPNIYGLNKTLSSSSYSIYSSNEVTKLSQEDIKKLIVETESFYGTNFQAPIRFIFFSSEKMFERISGIKKARMATRIDGIYISPRGVGVTEEDFKKFLKHELSHKMLMQIMDYQPNKMQAIYYYFKLPTWLNEGLATLNGQHIGIEGYPNMHDIKIILSKNQIKNPYLFLKNRTTYKPEEFTKNKVFYSLSSFFVNSLIENFGKNRLNLYLLSLSSSTDWEIEFEKNFNISFQDYVQLFIANISKANLK